MKISKQGIDLIFYFEDVKLKPYLCPANKVTISAGVVLLDENGNMLEGKEGLEKAKELYPELQNITNDKAIELFKNTIVKYENKINSLKLSFKQNEFDALVSFIYNLGFGSLLESTLLKRIKDKQGDIKEAFLMWNKCSGKVLSGLTKRREAEAELFLNNKLII